MILFKNVHESWIPLLHSLAHKESMVNFLESLNQMSFQPAIDKIFKVFEMPVKDIKVVLLGQDPYPIPGAAVGLSYAVTEKTKMPIILRSMEKEIYHTKGIRVLNDENDIVDQSWRTLNHLSEQGVFLLNKTLTVETGSAGSHTKYWKEFTDNVISYISEENPCIWLLWGSLLSSTNIKIKKPFSVTGYDETTIEEIPIDSEFNYIIYGDHPITGAGFSRKGFYYTNRILDKKSLKQIIW